MKFGAKVASVQRDEESSPEGAGTGSNAINLRTVLRASQIMVRCGQSLERETAILNERLNNCSLENVIDSLDQVARAHETIANWLKLWNKIT